MSWMSPAGKFDELAELKYEFVQFNNWNCKFDELDELSKIASRV